MEKYIDYYKTQEFFNDKNCIVTGATGGVGSLLVNVLCELNAKVVAFVKDEKKFINMFRPQLDNKKLLYEVIDFTKNEPAEKFKSAAMKLNGKIDHFFYVMENTIQEN